MPRAGLKDLIATKFASEAAMARALGWKRQRLNKITTGSKEPDLHEASDMANVLDVSISQIASFFLEVKSPNG